MSNSVPSNRVLITELAMKLAAELISIMTENGTSVEVKREKDNFVIIALKRKVKLKLPIYPVN